MSTLSSLISAGQITYDYRGLVESAFSLGLWYDKLPHRLAEEDADDLIELDQYDTRSNNYNKYTFKIRFISDTTTSWHPLYQELRRLGWEREEVWRDGGLLCYVMTISGRESIPEDYRSPTLCLEIALSTCKRVQTGTRMVEEPVYETVCEDVIEPEEEIDLPGESAWAKQVASDDFAEASADLDADAYAGQAKLKLADDSLPL